MVRLKDAKFLKIRIFDSNSTWDCFTVLNSCMIGLDLVRKKDVKFQKIQIFDHNCTPDCFAVKNTCVRGLDVNTKKTFLSILEFPI